MLMEKPSMVNTHYGGFARRLTMLDDVTARATQSHLVVNRNESFCLALVGLTSSPNSY